MADENRDSELMEPLMRSKTFEETEMDITSMIDLTFLLLIFFLVAGKMDPTGQIQLPPARYGMPVVEKSSIILTLAAAEDGKAIVYCGNGIVEQNRINGSDLAAQEERVANYVEHEFLSGAKENVLIKAAQDLKTREVTRIAKAATRNESVQQLFVAVTEVK